MKKLIRNMSNPKSAAFWQSIDRSAEGMRNAPAWMKAGIDVNERNFITFGPALSPSGSVPPRSNRGE